ncbi:MAG TPA: hypothetical protein DCL77_09750 [Prolixibacteraceae bacterium]|jgi:hypothetical protein|nr:hypothetical protein [Prolixibacteraceae bacterium]
MNKLLPIIILLSCISTFSYSQSKTEFGLTTEGSWFMPQHPYSHEWQTKAGFGTGIGVYASRNLIWRFSADIGLAYRYKQMKQHYVVRPINDGSYSGNSGGYGSSGGGDGFVTIEGWDKLPMHYIVVPLHLQLLLTKSFFIRGGIESTWLMNYQAVKEKPEYNWTLGFGSQKHKLKWSVNYIKGFKDQGFVNRTMKPDGHYIGSTNRNTMLQLNLSYPIWQK